MSLLCPPDGQTGEEFNIRVFGQRYHGTLDDFIDRHVYLFGGWELHILALMSELASAYRSDTPLPVTYVDVGANTGQHALFMSGHADTVICFEPFEPVRRCLENRIRDNHIRNISVVPTALSAQGGTSFYYCPEGRNQGTGSLVPGFSVGNKSTPMAVKTDIGDNYFGDPANPAVTILKVDVEGVERAVLQGLRQTLVRCRPAVILELSEYTRDDIGSLAGLYDLLYPGAIAFTIEHAPWRVGYRLQPCDFRARSDILIISSELCGRIRLSASFGSVPEGFPHLRNQRKAPLPEEQGPAPTPDESWRTAVDGQSPMGTGRRVNVS